MMLLFQRFKNRLSVPLLRKKFQTVLAAMKVARFLKEWNQCYEDITPVNEIMEE